MQFGAFVEVLITVVLFIAASVVKLYLDYTEPEIDHPREPSR